MDVDSEQSWFDYTMIGSVLRKIVIASLVLLLGFVQILKAV